MTLTLNIDVDEVASHAQILLPGLPKIPHVRAEYLERKSKVKTLGEDAYPNNDLRIVLCIGPRVMS